MKVKGSLKESANIKIRKYDHTECSPARMVKDAKAIENMMNALQEWDANPWDTTIQSLHSLESGLLASEELVKDFYSAKEEGEKQVKLFFDERILTNEKQIYDRIKLNKRSSFSKPPVIKKPEKVRKTDAMENRAMVKIIGLAEKSAVDLDELMGYRLTDVCLPIFKINGNMRKAVKSTLFSCFELHETSLDGVSYISIIDMGFIWRLATPSTTDRESAGGELTWGNYATKIFKMIIQRHPNALEYHLVSDRYDVDMSIKDAEHQRRTSMFVGGSRNVFPSSNLTIPPVRKFNSFFGNAENKIRLQEFLFNELQSFAKNEQKTFIYTLKERCYSVNPTVLQPNFFCHQHESDTRMFYHASRLDRRGDISRIVIDAEDTDVAVIASYASFQFDKELILYRKKQTISCKQLCSQEMSAIILSLHAITGADAVSGFYEHSKKAVYEKVKKIEEAQQLISNLGRNDTLYDEDIKKCSTFLINFMYADKSSRTIAEARAKKWRAMKNKTTLRLPPDEDSFIQHLHRANYQAWIWYNYGNPDGPPNPLGHGYMQEGLLVLPKPHTKEAYPMSLRNFIHEEEQEEDDSSDDGDSTEYSSSSDED